MISVRDLALARGERRLFSGLTFAVAAGEAVALTGPNGAGKTSLLRAIAGLIRPESGEIAFGGLEVDEARARHIHLLGHQDGLKGARTAGEELGFWTAWLGGTAAGLARAVEGLALSPLLPLDVRRLSAGQRRRLALARLLAAPRPVWLLDEPFAPLDSARRAQFGDLMKEHLAGGGAILAAVHDPLPIPSRTVKISSA